MKVTFKHGDKEFIRDVSSDEPLIKELMLLDTNLQFSCGGNGVCGKCVMFINGEVNSITPQEESFLGKSLLSPPDNYFLRLACFTYPKNDCDIIIPVLENDSKILFNSENFEGKKRSDPEDLGFAVDIGTTTISVNLYNLHTGTFLNNVSQMNNQRKYGADVLSRIDYSNKNGTDTLSSILISQLEDMFLQALGSISINYVAKIVITGNTTMLHFLTGHNPEGIGVSPFTPESLFGYSLNACELFETFSENTKVYLPKCLSAYIGADITTGILASGMINPLEKNILVDIGTNGEMALYLNGKIYTCSTAAGPAFEGAEIDMGMSASNGAISKIKIDSEITYQTIGDALPIGICGTGLISALSEMLANGIISESGELLSEGHDYTNSIKHVDNNKVFYITDKVFISQSDIRKLQMAKSAIYSGLVSLLNAVDLPLQSLDNLYISGGFGSFIDLTAAVNMGLFPTEMLQKAKSIGNSALNGAAMLLFNESLRSENAALFENAEDIDLSTNQFFVSNYIDSMFFSSVVNKTD